MSRLSVLCFLLFISCDYFESKKVKADDIVSQELETIDWNSVDAYPSFSVCDSLSQKAVRKECFESTVLSHVNNYLAEQYLVVSQDVEDTIAIQLQIDKLGDVTVLDITSKPETKLAIPTIDSLLRESIATLPKTYPAIKRGQQVTTTFVLPVTVSIK